MNRKLQDVTFVVVDLETTGGAPFGDSEITEFGAVKICGGQVLGEFSTFVKPRLPVPQFITELTGIDDQMLQDAPSIDQVLPQFFEWVSDCVLIAHNAPFDISFLKAAAQQLEFAWPDYVILDTVKIARAAIARDEIANYKLGTLAEFFDTEVKPTHRALDDAQTTVEVFHRCLERFGSQVETLTELTLVKRIKN